MTLVSGLDLPAFDYPAADFPADRYRQQLAEIRQQGWPAKSPLATHYCLGANPARAELEEALAFLAPRMPGLALDGPPQLGGVEGVYGIDKLPVIWST